MAQYREDSPYRVEPHRTNYKSCYAITRSGEDCLCIGDDLVFLHRLVDLLNEDEQQVEGR
jgi:hypothetical protein